MNRRPERALNKFKDNLSELVFYSNFLYYTDDVSTTLFENGPFRLNNLQYAARVSRACVRRSLRARFARISYLNLDSTTCAS